MGSTISKIKFGSNTTNTVKVKLPGMTSAVEPNIVVNNHTTVYCKAFSINDEGSAPIKSIACNRTSSPYANATTGAITLDYPFYYADKVKFTITNYAGYKNVTYKIGSTTYTSGSEYTVTGTAGITATGTQQQLTAPTITDITTTNFAITNPNSVNCKYTIYTDSTGSREVIVSGVAIGANATKSSGTLTAGYTYSVYFEDNSGECYATSDTSDANLNALTAPVFEGCATGTADISNPNYSSISLVKMYMSAYTSSGTWGTATYVGDIARTATVDVSSCYKNYARIKLVDAYSTVKKADSSYTYIMARSTATAPVLTQTTATSFTVRNDNIFANRTLALYYKLSGDSKYVKAGNVADNGGTITVTGLSPVSTYYCYFYDENYDFTVYDQSDTTTCVTTTRGTLSAPVSYASTYNTITVQNKNTVAVTLTFNDTDYSVSASSTKQITGLSAETGYSAQFTNSEWTGSSVVTLYTCIATPTVAANDTTSLYITNNGSQAYTYYYKEYSASSYTAGSSIAKNVITTVSSLKNGSRYDFYMSHGSTNYGDSATATGYTKLSAPAISSLAQTSFVVTNNNNVAVQCTCNSTIVDIAASGSTTFSSLTPGMLYEVTFASKQSGASSVTSTTSTTTTKYDFSAITITPNATSTNATTGFSLANPNTVAVTVAYGASGNTVSLAANGGTGSVSSLAWNTTYSFTIQADSTHYAKTQTATTNKRTLSLPSVSAGVSNNKGYFTATNPSANPAVNMYYSTSSGQTTSGTKFATNLAAGSTSSQVSDLAINTKYYIYEEAYDGKQIAVEYQFTTGKGTLTAPTMSNGGVAHQLVITNNNSIAVIYTLATNTGTTVDVGTISANSNKTITTSTTTSTGTNIADCGQYKVYFSATNYNDTSAVSAYVLGALVAPSITVNSSTSLTVTNSSSNPTVTAYYNTSNTITGATSIGSIDAGKTATQTGLTKNTTYYIFFTASTYVNSSNSAKTNNVYNAPTMSVGAISTAVNTTINITNNGPSAATVKYKKHSDSSWTTFGSVASNASTGTITAAWNTDYDVQLSASGMDTYTASNLGSTALRKLYDPSYTISYADVSVSNTAISPWTSAVAVYAYVIEDDDTGTYQEYDIAAGGTHGFSGLKNGTNYTIRFDATGYTSAGVSTHTNLIAPAISNVGTTSFRVTNNNNIAVTCGVNSASYTIASGGYKDITGLSMNTSYTVTFESADAVHSSASQTTAKGTITTPTISAGATSTASTTSISVKNNASYAVTLYYKLSTASSYTSYGSVASGATATISSLTWNSTYNLKLSVTNYNDYTANQTTNKRTLATPSASASSSTTITVTNNDSVSATYYVYLGSATTATTSGSITGGGTTVVTGLAASNTYKVLIAADGYINSGYASVTTLGTLSAPTFTAAAATTASTTSFTVKNNSSVAVELYYNTAGTSSSSWTDYGSLAANTTSSSITLASWNTTYYYKLVASGYETKTGTLGTTNKKKLASPTVSPSTASATSIVISDTSGVASTYYVYNYSSGSQVATGSLGASSSTTVTGLAAQTVYKVKITASNYTDSDYSTVTTYGTLSAPTLSNENVADTLKITNPNNVAVTYTIWPRSASSYTKTGSISANSSVTIKASSVYSAYEPGWYFIANLSASTYVDSANSDMVYPLYPFTYAPSITLDSTNPSSKMSVANNNDVAVNVYYGTSSDPDAATLVQSNLSSGASAAISSLTPDTQYYVFFKKAYYAVTVSNETTYKVLANPTITVTSDWSSLNEHFTVTNNANVAVSCMKYWLKQGETTERQNYISESLAAGATSASFAFQTCGATYTSDYVYFHLNAEGYEELITDKVYVYRRTLPSPTIHDIDSTSFQVDNPCGFAVGLVVTNSSGVQVGTITLTANATNVTYSTGLSAGNTYYACLRYNSSAYAYDSEAVEVPILKTISVSLYDAATTFIQLKNNSEDAITAVTSSGTWSDTGTVTTTIASGSTKMIRGFTSGVNTSVRVDYTATGYKANAGIYYTRMAAPTRTATTSTSITLKNTNDHEAYIVYKLNTDTDYTYWPTPVSAGSTIEITGLSSDTKYDFRCSCSPYSDSWPTSYTTYVSKLAAPTNVTTYVTSLSCTNPNSISADLYYAVGSASASYTKAGSIIARGNAHITGLTRANVYYLKLVQTGTSDSDAVYCVTLSYPVTPVVTFNSTGTTMTVKNNSYDTVTLNIDPVGGSTENYSGSLSGQSSYTFGNASAAGFDYNVQFVIGSYGSTTLQERLCLYAPNLTWNYQVRVDNPNLGKDVYIRLYDYDQDPDATPDDYLWESEAMCGAGAYFIIDDGCGHQLLDDTYYKFVCVDENKEFQSAATIFYNGEEETTTS